MKKLLIIAICLAVIAFAVNIYAGQQIKNYAHYPLMTIFLPYPESVASGYKPQATSLSLEMMNMRLKAGMSEESVFKLLGLPQSGFFSSWYEFNLNWNKNFSWKRWASGELWDTAAPSYRYNGGIVTIVYDEQRNIKELYYS